MIIYGKLHYTSISKYQHNQFVVKPTGFLHNHKNYSSPVNLVYYFSLITQTKEKLSDTINNTGLQKTAFNITKECLLLNKFIK